MVVNGFWRQRRMTNYGFGRGDNRGGQWQHVGASEVGGCGWWRRGRLEIQGGGGGELFLGWAMFWGSKVRRRGVFSKLFLLSNLTAENTQDHSVLTKDKNLCVCRLLIFRLQLITILAGM
jgi:hypothetical protein